MSLRFELCFRILCITPILLHLRLCYGSSNRETIILGTSDLPEYTHLHEQIFNVLNKQLKDHIIVPDFMPYKRLEASARSGRIDGIAFRAAYRDISMSPPNLKRIESPLFYANSVLGLHADSRDITEVRALSSLKIAVVNGASDSTLLIPKNAAVPVNHLLGGLMMVAKGRVDAMALPELGYYSVALKSSELAKKTRLATLRTAAPYFIFISTRKIMVIPKLHAAIKLEHRQIQGIHDKLIHQMKSRSY